MKDDGESMDVRENIRENYTEAIKMKTEKTEQAEKTEKDWEFLPKPKGEFIYIAARPYFPLVPKHPLLPESMSEEKGDGLGEKVGEIFEVKFDIPPRVTFAPLEPEEKYSFFASAPAKLETFARVPCCGEGLGLEYEVWDWVYMFQFRTEHKAFLKELLSRKDKYIHSSDAFDRAMCHWGTQDWGCLTMELLSDGTRFRTDVDIFAPLIPDGFPREHIKLSDVFVFGTYSHKPDLLKKLREK